MPVALRPTTELVACSWLSGIEGLSASMVATTLPDSTAWASTGFVQCYTVGGSPNKHNPMRRPVLSIDCWAVTLTSARPDWGKANWLAELIWDEAMNPRRARREVMLQVGSKMYPPARVLGVDILQEPRRVTGDPAGYAHYQFDMTLNWAEVA